jgi:hypothetical protein
LRILDNCGHNVAFVHLFEKGVVQLTLGSKVLVSRNEIFFGLTVKGGVLDETVHKNEEMSSNVRLRDVVLLLFECLGQMIDNLVRNVFHVRSSFCRSD